MNDVTLLHILMADPSNTTVRAARTAGTESLSTPGSRIRDLYDAGKFVVTPLRYSNPSETPPTAVTVESIVAPYYCSTVE
jgi:hypothetical protein